MIEAVNAALTHLGQDVAVLYNVACISALANSEDDCRKYLSECVKLSIASEPSSDDRIEYDEMVADDDLSSMRAHGWFSSIVQAVHWNSLDYLPK